MKLTQKIVDQADEDIVLDCELETAQELIKEGKVSGIGGFLRNSIPLHLQYNGFYTYVRERGEKVLIRLASTEIC